MIDNMFQVFLRLKNFEINVVKYINHHCNEAFEENEKIVDKLLHRLSQHGEKHMLSYVNCDVETSRAHQIRLQSPYFGLGVRWVINFIIEKKFSNIEIRKLKKLLFDTD
ncbi:hypothetical protein RFI_39187 [Reticulomyxa filosa]|uniref:Uncharacterized protein n=1 Tax=Reticulomyxa filosa TaxID=46433 RepID=X6L9W6_RETFI|nr:hypothetical protein RFI_39187 [Reticulomyxa filosa]|eukprot:ETN98323.1 hypothetical protein RFI_39187 [Reticulomyxa filosa]